MYCSYCQLKIEVFGYMNEKCIDSLVKSFIVQTVADVQPCSIGDGDK